MANTGRGLPRPIDGCDGTGRLTPCRGGAVNLWTVGCADPRLTAPARSPMDKPGKTQCVSPPCPQVGGCSQALQHSATARDDFDVQTTGTVAVSGSQRLSAGPENRRVRVPQAGLI